MPLLLLKKFSRDRADLLRRFVDMRNDALSDAELLELILAAEPGWHHPSTLPQRLLTTFGSLSKVIDADAIALQAVEGMTGLLTLRLKTVRLTMHHVLRAEITDRTVIHCWSTLMDYCRLTMGNSKVEEFRVLFLNHAHVLLADEAMHRGTINHTPVYPREVVKRALELGAAAMILLHNHPSGDTTPSKADIDMTNRIVEAAATMGIAVHDHVIIAGQCYYSFKSFGLITEPSTKAVPSSDPATPQPAELLAAAEPPMR